MNTSVADFYSGKSVFITGGTGFLGKVLIEKLLRTCVELDKIFVLIRAKKGIKIEERVKQIYDNELFKLLHTTNPNASKKIVPVVGDVTLPNLGINPQVEEILRENVSVVFHSAASVYFNEPLKSAVNINIDGTRRVLELCKRLKRIDAFVYISTAFSNCNRTVVDEVVYPPPMPLDEVYKLMEQDYSAEELKKHFNGLPNTYTFTKAIAENYVLENHGEVPTVIIRPSGIKAIAKEPLPGWLENWFGATRVAYNLAHGYTRVVHGDKRNVLDIVPADYSANVAIVAASRCKQNKEVTVYHNCSSSVNPISYEDFFTVFSEETARNGSNEMYAKFWFLKSKPLVEILSFFFETTPANVADFWLMLTGRSPKYVKNLSRAKQLCASLGFFLDSSWVFLSRNTSSLHESLTPNEQIIFPCDPADIDWKPYLEQYSQGVRKYLLGPDQIRCRL